MKQNTGDDSPEIKAKVADYSIAEGEEYEKLCDEKQTKQASQPFRGIGRQDNFLHSKLRKEAIEPGTCRSRQESSCDQSNFFHLLTILERR